MCNGHAERQARFLLAFPCVIGEQLFDKFAIETDWRSVSALPPCQRTWVNPELSSQRFLCDAQGYSIASKSVGERVGVGKRVVSEEPDDRRHERQRRVPVLPLPIFEGFFFHADKFGNLFL